MLNLNEALQIKTIIYRGAEAVIYSGMYLNEKIVLKIRYPKKYRHPQLDYHLRFTRTKLEARILQRSLTAGVNVPSVMAILTRHAGLVLKHVEGSHLTTFLETPKLITNEEQQRWPRALHEIFQQIGTQVGRLHASGIAHGDLTPHNMILSNDLQSLHIIDFGLATITNDPEKFATDLFTFLRTMQTVAKWDASPLFEAFLNSYKMELAKKGRDHATIHAQFKDLKKRGRYQIREKGFYEE